MKLLAYLSLILLISCSSQKEQFEVYSISSKANCKGPKRSYHTELHATVDGYTRFHQSYTDGSQDYDAVIYNDTLGFTTKGDSAIDRWIKSAEISVGKGHSFHMIAIKPQEVFSYSNGKYFDPIGNEVILFFDEHSNNLESFVISNPFNESEKIEIFYSEWEKIEGVELPMRVKIIQGGKAEFYFHFYEVKINDSNFKKIPY